MKHLRWLVVFPFLWVVLSGCAGTQTFLDPKSMIAREQANLYWTILWMAVAVFVIVEVLLLYNIIAFRKKKDDNALAPQIYGNNLLEAIWTGIPVLLVIVLFVFAVNTVNAISAPAKASNDINIRVVGHQWWWEYQYPDYGFVTANDMVVPVGANVHMTLLSKDVIHSFWIPQLTGKIDVIPGQVNALWFNADEEGEFYGQCAEFCGRNHANMKIKVIVLSQEDFEAWAANEALPPVEPKNAQQEAGKTIVTSGVCKGCHTLGDSVATQDIGPNLNHLMSRTTFAGSMFPLDEEHLRSWLEDTQSMKPGNDMIVKLDEEEIDALVAYLLELK